VLAQQGGDAAGTLGHTGLDGVADQGGQHRRAAAGAHGGDHFAAVDDRRGKEVRQLGPVDDIDQRPGAGRAGGGLDEQIVAGDEGQDGPE